MSTLSESSQDSLGWVYPAPPVENVSVPVANQRGSVQLTVDQNYVDVAFHSTQVGENWILVGCAVVNTTDANPLNIAPGLITIRTLAGFRVQLNGLPDTSNYILEWAINGSTVPAEVATTYAFSGATSGVVGAAATFTVELLPDTTVEDTVTVTPSSGGGGGSFSPTSVEITTSEPSATFTYTPSSAGSKTISVTNDGALTNPDALTFVASAVEATAFTMSGPSSGINGVASTNFTVALFPVGGIVTGTVTVTPSSGGGGGTFTPTTVGLTTASPSATFTYTPASIGVKTISATNDGGLTNSGNLTYTVSFVGLNDGDSVSTWTDSSGNGHTASQTGSSRPIYKTAIVNGKPVVRFTSAGTSSLAISPAVTGTNPWTVFVVKKPAGTTFYPLCSGSQGGPVAADTAVSFIGWVNRSDYVIVSDSYSGAFHVFTGNSSAVPLINAWIDGSTVSASSGAAGTFTGDWDSMGKFNGGTYSDGDIAEIIIYNVTVGSTDRANIEKYLGTKYGISVAGGSAVEPDTVSGIAGWWKADSL